MYDVKSILLSQTSEITLSFCKVSLILQILSTNCVDYPNNWSKNQSKMYWFYYSSRLASTIKHIKATSEGEFLR